MNFRLYFDFVYSHEMLMPICDSFAVVIFNSNYCDNVRGLNKEISSAVKRRPSNPPKRSG